MFSDGDANAECRIHSCIIQITLNICILSPISQGGETLLGTSLQSWHTRLSQASQILKAFICFTVAVSIACRMMKTCFFFCVDGSLVT